MSAPTDPNPSTAVAGAVPAQRAPEADRTAIRPFHIRVPEEELVQLRLRLAATRWPDRETVPERSQGAQLSRVRALVDHWGTRYDWRRAAERANHQLIYFHEVDRGGHFAAWEQPELFAAELREAFRSLR
jgi:pimeloyl-ACP methyl ester carboxylesterase